MKIRLGFAAIALGWFVATCAASAEHRLGAAERGASAAPSLPTGVRVLRDVAYGNDPRQRFDVYLPRSAQHAPAILLVHGGSWAFGGKDHPGLIPNKTAHWLPKGYAMISMDYRMLPDAPPLEQAKDVARALAAAQRHAGAWRLDRDRFALMGHSAGAHLVAVLAADPGLMRHAGATAPRGAVMLDSAAYDVEQLMRGRHPRLYDRAFWDDPTAWKAASPYARLTKRGLPMLAVCSTRHVMASCAQARAFARKAAALGLRVDVLPQDLSHMQINRELGSPSAYTEKVDEFLRSLGV